MSLTAALALAAAGAAVASPPPRSCHEALQASGTIPIEAGMFGRVDGAGLTPERLVALRRERGDAVITVVGGSFAGADFRRARLDNICFVNTDLTGSDWRGARAAGVAFIWADLTGARLGGTRMAGVSFSMTKLGNVDASGADWSRGGFGGNWRAELGGLVLDGANLRGFAFHCGITQENICPAERPVSLRGADLSGAKIHRAQFRADFAGARLDRTEAGLHQLSELREARFAGPLILRGSGARLAIGRRDLREIVAAFRAPDEEPVSQASFDCADARTAVERMICSDEGIALRAPDLEMAAVYRRVLAAHPSVRAGQRAWLRERDRCSDRLCVERSYEARIGVLRGRAGPPAWLRRGTRALFIDEAVPFREAFRRTRLYRRIVPVLVGSATSRVVVSVNRDGTIDVNGDAIGPNAHLCDVWGDRLRFDRVTGWFSGPWSPHFDGPPDLSQPPMRVLRIDGDWAEVFRDGDFPRPDDLDVRHSDYTQCGARARFERMVRVPARPADFEEPRADLDLG